MKKLGVFVLLWGILTGCAAAPTFETLGPVNHAQADAVQEEEILICLPDDAQQFGDSYFCGDYYFEIKTVSAGDLDATIRAMCGFSQQELTVMTAGTEKYNRYEWVWSATGDEGEVICRAAVIDDGSHYHCLTTVAPAEKGGALRESWNLLFSSFQIG